MKVVDAKISHPNAFVIERNRRQRYIEGGDAAVEKELLSLIADHERRRIGLTRGIVVTLAGLDGKAGVSVRHDAYVSPLDHTLGGRVSKGRAIGDRLRYRGPRVPLRHEPSRKPQRDGRRRRS